MNHYQIEVDTPIEHIVLAGGCVWGVQEFMKYLPGVLATLAGRANGFSHSTQSEYDGYAESVCVQFDSNVTSIERLIDHLFEIINPYSVNQQGMDKGKKYRTGIYSKDFKHLMAAKKHINKRVDAARIAVEIAPLTNFVLSEEKHQHRLSRYPDDHVLCHIPWKLLHRYKYNHL